MIMQDQTIKMCLLDIIKNSVEILENYECGNNTQATQEQADKVREIREHIYKLSNDLLEDVPF